jgi:predicted AAA+ superfamily ATPase
MYVRWQETYLRQALETRRVLLITGPRQCGKTTLAKTLIQDGIEYRTLDTPALLEAAKLDPLDFVTHAGQRMIIDEIQRAPELLLAIKLKVDENPQSGQYILTGSANIQALPGVQESLAGRIRKIRLRPLSQGELLGRPPTFLDQSFQKRWSKTVEIENRTEVLYRAFCGGFPEALLLNDRERRQWHQDYVASLLDRDLQEIINLRRIGAMRQLVQTVAAWSSKFMNLSAIGTGLGIQRATLESYLNALEALYMIERLPAWLKTDYEYVNKQDKLFMTDSGLMTSLLEWQPEQVRLDADRAGKLMETFVFNELSALVDRNGGEYALYHYRDQEKREIDFLIKRDDGALLGIEIKAGSAVNGEAFKHLKWFKANLAKEVPFIGLVLYTGEQSLSFGDDCWAIPVNCLWGA